MGVNEQVSDEEGGQEEEEAEGEGEEEVCVCFFSEKIADRDHWETVC